MYVYNVGYGSPEESRERQYVHDRRFTKSEFQQVVEDCLFESLVALAEEEDDYYDLGGESQEHPTFSNCFHCDEFEKAIKRRGFVSLKIVESVVVMGWKHSIDVDSWPGHSNDLDNKYAKNLKMRIVAWLAKQTGS